MVEASVPYLVEEEEKDKRAARNDWPVSWHQHSINLRPTINLPRQ